MPLEVCESGCAFDEAPASDGVVHDDGRVRYHEMHIHAVADRPEIYYGQAGQGLMLMESPEGETRVVEMQAQTICYVPPYWIHRSVNTGSSDFVIPETTGREIGIETMARE